ncbi:SHOCT domain-containing protein [Lysinibacillus fusiformis]|uniref:Short C-terminal domain-containing protein n=1 Tax=Lysinibacillus fusiformis TaxID=28031 RepID=A0A1H9H9C5_9BACI|nr:SHOCT domain-containing protein [Lysinibacillus fusiformis]SCY29954.1 Short C-terminal domain-containing protein [Lysinibacillus fusiformis]SEN53968.1 Short C-terminal domain-containing protein [Lysinibacillus fusiformis]SEQ58876.1 Short C-terminal domain-containing protein [Lysinibacillus fusiformis]
MDTFAETIKLAGFGKKKMMAKQIQMFDDRFNDQGETLLAVCASVKGTEQLYVTDKRVLLHEIKGITSNDERSIPVSSISSINISNTLVHSSIEIVSTGNKAKIDNVPIHVAVEIKSAIENLKEIQKETSKETLSVPTPEKEKGMNNVAEEIRELKDLLDDGILTQDEFDAKKKQLLGI